MKKILHTIYTGFSAVVVTALTLASCIDDELVKTNDVVEGVPITVSLNLSGKATTDVTVSTRAGSDLSELAGLTLYIYDGNGKYQQTVSTTNNSLILDDPQPQLDNNNVRYSVSFQTTSGTKKLLAVGNPGASWWGKSVTELDASSLSFEELKEKLMTLAYNQNSDGEIPTPITITASDQMLISGWNEGIVFDTNGDVTYWGNSNDPVAVQMKRSMAEVTFNINGYNMFTPTSYKVYNVPTNAYVTNMDDNNIAESVVFNHFASSTVQTSETGTPYFRFYMPENIYNRVEGVGTEYQNRDKWSATTEEGYPLGKKWTYAPKTATFVVISGTYSGEAIVDGVQKDVTANVEYTVHLGDFSDNGGSMSDFSVKRNVSYTYNVSVEGVNNIVVEALTNEEKQPGAEGQVFDYTGTTYTYNLDAHYEQVYLEYNLTSIANNVRTALQNTSNPTDEEIDNAIADELILIIRSEAMDYIETDPDGSKGYTVQDRRGTLRPYKIYADAVRNKDAGTAAADAASAAKSAVLVGAGEGINPTKGIDYKWVEFWPQSEQTLASYPGVSDWSKDDVTELINKDVYGGEPTSNNNDFLMDVYDVVVAMGKVVKKIYNGVDQVSTAAYGEDGITVTQNGNDYVARFTAFVNENYYYHHPLTGMKVNVWSVLTDKIPREMIIAMDTHTSSDGNSSYSKLYTYISQLSMKTIYNSRNESIDGFGVETYNETPLTSEIATWGTPYNGTYTLNDSDGRGNQKKLLGLSSNNIARKSWSNYIVAANNGWKTTNSTEHSLHKLSGDAYANTYRGAYAACLSRNRDLNGNGVIDDNEVRWYLASLNEYIRMGIGESVLGDAKLYFGVKSSMVYGSYPDSYIGQGALYFTSSGTNKRVFWAVEKGAYGGNNDSEQNPGYTLPIRCIRLLPADVEGKQDISSLTKVDDNETVDIVSASSFEKVGDYGLKFSDRLVDGLYREQTTTRLARHHEDADANKFFEGIIVAEDYLSGTYQLGRIVRASGYSTVNPCANYSEYGDGNATWRVPNLVELSAMNAAGLLSVGNNGSTTETACCTYFSNTSIRAGFAYSTLIYCPGGGGGNNPINSSLNSYFRVRCVRDVSAADLGSN